MRWPPLRASGRNRDIRAGERRGPHSAKAPGSRGLRADGEEGSAAHEAGAAAAGSAFQALTPSFPVVPRSNSGITITAGAPDVARTLA